MITKQNDNDQQEIVNQIYECAANLLVTEKKSPNETKNLLIEEGLDKESASVVVESLVNQLEEAKRERANKDMLYGALWCIGGTIATAADIGFIFCGAIVLGAIQFFKGVAKF